MSASFVLAAAESTETLFAVLSSALVGGAVFVLFYWIVRTLASDDLQQGDDWRYDVTRINELRRQEPTYRLFQPLIDLLARFNRVLFPASLPEIQRELQAAGLSRFWLPEEYLGRAQLVGLLLAPWYLFGCVQWLGWQLGVPLGLALAVATVWLLRRRLTRMAQKRLTAIKRRMPFLLDLLTLLMEAGSTFLHALDEAVHEFAGQPVAVELNRVLADIRLGKTRDEAFFALRDRLSDDEIRSIVGAIVQGERLGTPLAHIFRTQADMLRIKRTQRAEGLASEAGVTMLLPAVLVMVSSVLVILGPFLLNFFYFGFGF